MATESKFVKTVRSLIVKEMSENGYDAPTVKFVLDRYMLDSYLLDPFLDKIAVEIRQISDLLENR